MIMLMDSLQIMERKTCNNPSGPLCRQVGQVGFGFVHFDDAEAAIKAAEMVKGDEHTTLDCQLSVNLRRSLDGIYQQGQAPRTHSSSRPTLPTTGLSRSHRRGPYFDRGHVQHPLSATSDTHLPPRHFHHHHNHHQRDASKSSNHTYNSTDTLPTRPHDHHTMVHMPPVITMPPAAYHTSSMPMPMSPMCFHGPSMMMNMEGTSPHHNHNHDHNHNQHHVAWYATNVSNKPTEMHPSLSMNATMVSPSSYQMYGVPTQHTQQHPHTHQMYDAFDTQGNHIMVQVPLMMSPTANHNYQPSTMPPMPFHAFPMNMHMGGVPSNYGTTNMEGVSSNYAATNMGGVSSNYGATNMEGVSPGYYYPYQHHNDGYYGYDKHGMPMHMSMPTSGPTHPHFPPPPTYAPSPVSPIVEMDAEAMFHATDSFSGYDQHLDQEPPSKESYLALIEEENDTPKEKQDFVGYFPPRGTQPTVPAFSA